MLGNHLQKESEECRVKLKIKYEEEETEMNKPKKKLKKKKLKTIGKLKEEADRCFQDHFRRVKTHCEMCGWPYQVAHHFIWKSQSNYLRYDEKNLIFICNKCHSKFHSFPDPDYPIRVYKMRGKKWEEYIEKHRHLLKIDNRKELESVIVKYQK